MKKRMRTAAALMAAILLFGTAGCGRQAAETGADTTAEVTAAGGGQQKETNTPENGTAQQGTEKEKGESLPPLKLSIMLPYGTNENDDNETVQRFRGDIEAYTNTEIEWIFYASDMYYEKLTLLFTSGDLPSIMVVNKNSEFINAANNGAFWEVGDYIKEYDNLATMSETVYLNASINGKLFAIPRSRTLARNGVGYRLDWLNNLGLKEPETIDEFYDMLVAFTNGDPDGNGKNDTYGLGISSYAGPWDIMQLWFGVPNGWGIDAEDNLVPAHLTAEYDTALKWFRKIYSEGLVNPDFRDYPSDNWDELLRGGVAGASADVLDRFRRNQTYFDTEGIPAETMLIGAIDAGFGIRCLPTSGYSGMIAISTSKVKTEEDMKRALGFLNDLNDAEMRNLIEYGYEGITWGKDADGYPAVYAGDDMKLGFDLRSGYNQMIPYFHTEEEISKFLTGAPNTGLRALEAQLYEDDMEYCIPNYGAPYTSETYVASGADLDKIINDARLDYITGVIDDVGLQEAKDQWLRSGGEDVVKEMNELYRANQ